MIPNANFKIAISGSCVTLLLIALLSGCAARGLSGPAERGSAAASADTVGAYALDAMASRLSAAQLDYSFLPPTVADALPSTTYNIEQGPTGKTVSSTVVIGSITGWEKGEADVWSSLPSNATGPKVVAWTDPSAETRVLFLSVKVGTVVATAKGIEPPGDGTTVRLWVTVDGSVDAETFADSFISLGNVLVFLNPKIATTPSGYPAYPVAYNNALLGLISSDGAISMPLMNFAFSEGQITDNVHNLADLKQAAATSRTIEVPLPGATDSASPSGTD